MTDQEIDNRFDIRKLRSRDEAGTLVDVPFTMVSADGHAMLPARDYRQYMDPKYREELETYIHFIDTTWVQTFDLAGYPHPPEVLERIDTRDAIRGGGELGSCDPYRRMHEVEAEGVVCEVMHPDGPLSLAPFFPSNYSVVSPEIRAAGAVAHNRWLVDFCSADPRRLIGAHLIYPHPDMDAAVEQCRLAAESGTKAIMPPQQAGVEGDSLPAFTDAYYDPMWAACQDLGLVVQIHAGWGNPQGGLDALMAMAANMASDNLSSLIAEALDTFGERKPLWQLMFGGVFDRFPRLRVAFTEIHCDWVPETLAILETFVKDHPMSMKLRPSEYWARHCAVGASCARFGDLAVRHDVGLEKVMFATDYPHVEGSWPNSLEFIRTTMGDLPEVEVRKMLGDNAIEFYGLDKDYLDGIARRVGPLPDSILRAPPVDPFFVDIFDQRAGLRKSVNLHLDELIPQIQRDAQAAQGISSTATR